MYAPFLASQIFLLETHNISVILIQQYTHIKCFKNHQQHNCILRKTPHTSGLPTSLGNVPLILIHREVKLFHKFVQVCGTCKMHKNQYGLH